MIIVTFHMKSGAAINVHCEKMKTETNNNDLKGYSLEGIDPPGQAHYIRLDDVSAITYKEEE